MGPTIILDKSAFQALSKDDHFVLDWHFIENLTPVLALELIGDLSKGPRGSKPADKVVEELSGKFGGSGPATNVDHRTLCVQSLLGNPIAMDGRIIAQSAGVFRGPDGEKGVIIDLSGFNKAILRWRRGKFEEAERRNAELWRKAIGTLDLNAFQRTLLSYHVILPKVRTPDEAKRATDELLGLPTLQQTWLLCLMDHMGVDPRDQELIWIRWRSTRTSSLGQFAPYAKHCLRVVLLLTIANHHGLIGWLPTHLIDAQYLHYLPFCTVFASNDRLHRKLAPLLLRGDQDFVFGEELKSDLQRISRWRSGLDDRQRRMFGYSLGNYPPPGRGSVVHELWKKHCQKWAPGSGNMAITLTATEKKEALLATEQLFRDVEGDSYFRG